MTRKHLLFAFAVVGSSFAASSTRPAAQRQIRQQHSDYQESNHRSPHSTPNNVFAAPHDDFVQMLFGKRPTAAVLQPRQPVLRKPSLPPSSSLHAPLPIPAAIVNDLSHMGHDEYVDMLFGRPPPGILPQHRYSSPSQASHVASKKPDPVDPFTAEHEEYVRMLFGKPPFYVQARVGPPLSRKQVAGISSPRKQKRLSPVKVKEEEGDVTPIQSIAPRHVPAPASQDTGRESALNPTTGTSEAKAEREKNIKKKKKKTRHYPSQEAIEGRSWYYNQHPWQLTYHQSAIEEIHRRVRPYWGTGYGPRAHRAAKLRLWNVLDEDKASKILKGNPRVTKEAAEQSMPILHDKSWKRPAALSPPSVASQNKQGRFE